MKKLPTDWCIEATEQNFAELYPWWRANADSAFSAFTIEYTLMSSHRDGSCYYGGCIEDCVEAYPNYQPITIEQFRQITNSNPNPISKHPENWYIPLTADNYAHIKPWWLEQVEKNGWKTRHLHDHHLVLSNHPKDNSHYWSGSECQFKTKHPSYEKITLEQFLQITKPMNTLPTKWYIEATEENHEELNSWRRKNAAAYLSSGYFQVGHTLLSEHLSDHSCYYSSDADELRKDNNYKDYQEITLEEFRQITNQNQKPMTKSIQISRELLNEYYEASTGEQKVFLAEHFKLDGTTTDEAIRKLHDLACKKWKPRIKNNHPDCFPEEKHFDFSSRPLVRGIVSDEVADSLGMKHNFIQLRNNHENPETHYRSFYLATDYNWELKQDGSSDGRPVMVLIPTKK